METTIIELNENYYHEFQLLERQYTNHKLLEYLKKEKVNNPIFFSIDNIIDYCHEIIKYYQNDETQSQLIAYLEDILKTSETLPEDITAHYPKFRKQGIVLCALEENKMVGFIAGLFNMEECTDLYSIDNSKEVLEKLNTTYLQYRSNYLKK